jgi:hypothetical protein
MQADQVRLLAGDFESELTDIEVRRALRILRLNQYIRTKCVSPIPSHMMPHKRLPKKSKMRTT